MPKPQKYYEQFCPITAEQDLQQSSTRARGRARDRLLRLSLQAGQREAQAEGANSSAIEETSANNIKTDEELFKEAERRIRARISAQNGSHGEFNRNSWPNQDGSATIKRGERGRIRAGFNRLASFITESVPHKPVRRRDVATFFMGGQMTDERRKEVAVQILMWAFGLYVSVSVLAMGWIAAEVISHSSRLVAIESNRFTAHDGQQIYNKLHEMSMAIGKMPQECPPAWFVSRFNKMEEKVERLERGR